MMEYRRLGRTNLDVSVLSLGTVSLGRDYGIRVPDGFGRPPDAEAIRLLVHAADAGINFFDTAPGYGEAEALLGEALGPRRGCCIATKIPVPPVLTVEGPGTPHARRSVREYLESSLRRLRRDVLDIVQINNPTTEQLREGMFTEILDEARRDGLVRWIGASVYGEQAGLAAIETGRIDILQVAYNLLDQRMGDRVLQAARSAGVGVIGRSALLQGALTPKAQWLPSTLSGLRDAADRARIALGTTWEALPGLAYRFCVSATPIATTLTGARTMDELNGAIAAAVEGPLPAETLSRASHLRLDDERLVDPTKWTE
jgi:aryl-alcohol dehydrogenase-like predicted oxidoreductase